MTSLELLDLIGPYLTTGQVTLLTTPLIRQVCLSLDVAQDMWIAASPSRGSLLTAEFPLTDGEIVLPEWVRMLAGPVTMDGRECHEVVAVVSEGEGEYYAFRGTARCLTVRPRKGTLAITYMGSLQAWSLVDVRVPRTLPHQVADADWRRIIDMALARMLITPGLISPASDKGLIQAAGVAAFHGAGEAPLIGRRPVGIGRRFGW